MLFPLQDKTFNPFTLSHDVAHQWSQWKGTGRRHKRRGGRRKGEWEKRTFSIEIFLPSLPWCGTYSCINMHQTPDETSRLRRLP